MLLVRLAPRLRERGHAQSIVCSSRSRGRQNLRHALGEQGFALRPLPIGGKANPRALASLLRAARRSQAELSHSHLSTASWWCGWLDRLGLLPSVGHVQGFTSPLFHRNQSQLIACSQAVKDHIVEGGIKPEHVTVLPNPVAPEDIRPGKPADLVRRELGVDEDAPLIGCFAGLLEKKGWRELLGAMPEVVRCEPRAILWCVGEGPLRAELEALAKSLGVSRAVRFLGFRRDVADLMNAVDVMALPSHREPFGIVYVEAALLGKPCLACAAGGAPDVVRHGETGLLVPPRDAQATARALCELLEDRARARKMGEAGREYVLEHFGWGRFLPALEEVYAKALDRR